MLGHLWAQGPQPREYQTLILCRDVYHCLPSQLAAEPLGTVLAHMTMLSAEYEVAELKAKRKGRRR